MRPKIAHGGRIMIIEKRDNGVVAVFRMVNGKKVLVSAVWVIRPKLKH